MKSEWLAEVTNDPRRDFDLCIQLSQSDQHWALIERQESGELVLTVDPSKRTVQVPARWLAETIMAAERNLPREGTCGNDRVP